MRRTALLVLLPLLPLLPVILAPSPSPAADVEMCQGKPATIVWDGDVTGPATDGNDVIVAHDLDASDIRIDTAGGDDLLCITSDQPARGTYFRIEGGSGTDSLELRLGDDANKVEYWLFEKVDVDLGGGFDKLMVGGWPGTGTIDGGADSATLQFRAQRIDVNLLTETLRIDDGLFTLTHFTRVSGWAPKRLSMTGDDQDNGFRAQGCHITIRGGGGDDVLKAKTRPFECKNPTMRLVGEGGDDRMVGSPSKDVLLGGPGRDVADGMRGKDKCVAETVRNCER